jgi:hypothetical protein
LGVVNHQVEPRPFRPGAKSATKRVEFYNLDAGYSIHV